MTNLVPLIQGLIAAAGIIIGAVLTAMLGVRTQREQKRIDRENYRQQKDIDRQVDLRKRKEEEYLHYLKAYEDYSRAKFLGQPEKLAEASAEYDAAINNLFLIAPDDVIRAVTDFHWAGIRTEQTSDKWKELYATMIITMRQDVFDATKLSIAEIGDRLPWYYGDEGQPYPTPQYNRYLVACSIDQYASVEGQVASFVRHRQFSVKLVFPTIAEKPLFLAISENLCSLLLHTSRGWQGSHRQAMLMVWMVTVPFTHHLTKRSELKFCATVFDKEVPEIELALA